MGCGYDIANDNVAQPLQGSQDKVHVPQVSPQNFQIAMRFPKPKKSSHTMAAAGLLGPYLVEVTELRSRVRCNNLGCLEANKAADISKIIRSNTYVNGYHGN